MSEKNYFQEAANATKEDLLPIKPGKYNASLLSVEQGYSKAGNDMMKFKYEIELDNGTIHWQYESFTVSLSFKELEFKNRVTLLLDLIGCVGESRKNATASTVQGHEFCLTLIHDPKDDYSPIKISKIEAKQSDISATSPDKGQDVPF